MVKKALRGGGANKYDAVIETDCIVIVSNVFEIYSYAAGKTKDGWEVFAYDYLPEYRCEDTYKNGYKTILEDKVYNLSFRGNENYRRIHMPTTEGPFSFEDAVKRLKELEAKGRKDDNLKIKNPRVEPDRHYSKFETAVDVPKRTKKIRHWKS